MRHGVGVVIITIVLPFFLNKHTPLLNTIIDPLENQDDDNVIILNDDVITNQLSNKIRTVDEKRGSNYQDTLLRGISWCNLQLHIVLILQKQKTQDKRKTIIQMLAALHPTQPYSSIKNVVLYKTARISASVQVRYM